MALIFPNASRSYDQTRDAVRFWGYQSSIECSFFVTTGASDAFNRTCARTRDFSALDANRDLMQNRWKGLRTDAGSTNWLRDFLTSMARAVKTLSSVFLGLHRPHQRYILIVAKLEESETRAYIYARRMAPQV